MASKSVTFGDSATILDEDGQAAEVKIDDMKQAPEVCIMSNNLLNFINTYVGYTKSSI